jgi:putative oxidoreductase
MCKKMFASQKSIALLITRLIVGGIFIYAGWMKISDMPMTLGFFSSLQIPAFLTYIVAYGEFIGGLLLVAGLWNEYAAFFLAVIMAVAVKLTIPLGFQMFSMPLVTLSALISLLGSGAGKYSLKLNGSCDTCQSCASCKDCDGCDSCDCRECGDASQS